MELLDLTAMNRSHAQRRLRVTAKDLRSLADRIERTAADLDRVAERQPGYRTHTRVIGEALHEVITFLANMHMESAFDYAAEADIAAAEAEIAGKE